MDVIVLYTKLGKVVTEDQRHFEKTTHRISRPSRNRNAEGENSRDEEYKEDTD